MTARATVVVELAADAQHARELSAGGVFVRGCSLALNSECDLVVRGAAEEVVFDARVVLHDDLRGGAALELVGFCPAMKDQLAALIATTPSTERLERYDADALGLNEFDELVRDVAAFDQEQIAFDETRRAQATEVDPQAFDDRRAQATEVDGGDASRFTFDDRRAQVTEVDDAQGIYGLDDLDDPGDPAVIHAALPPLDLGDPESGEFTLDDDLAIAHDLGVGTEDRTLDDDQGPSAPSGEAGSTDDGGETLDDDDEPDPERRKAALTVHERLRRLSLPQQLKKAHTGELQERIVLERMYGKTVWEPLLRNPRLTAPEVARIARMGQLPRPLIEIIVGNGGWLQVPEVRRALLSNPRLGTDQINRVLRLLPKHELKLASVQTAYPHAVRDAAKRMLRET